MIGWHDVRRGLLPSLALETHFTLSALILGKSCKDWIVSVLKPFPLTFVPQNTVLC